MRLHRSASLFITVAAALIVSVGCNNSEFTGSGKKASGKVEDAKEEPKEPNDTDTKPSDDAGDVGDEPADTTDPGLGNSADGNPILDTLKGLLGGDGDSAAPATQVNDNEIVFGTSKVFHIGDGQMSGSSCLAEIFTFGLSGKQYFFEFEVTQPGTQVNLTIEKVCGVDYPDTNFVSIQQNGVAIVAPQAIAAGASNIAVPSATLNAGKYVVLVESKIGTTSGNGDPTDADDYIVGNIRVKGTKAIKPGKVGAQ